MSQLALAHPLILQIKRKKKEKKTIFKIKEKKKKRKRNNDLADLPSHDTTLLSSFLSQTSFGHIFTNSSTILTVSKRA